MQLFYTQPINSNSPKQAARVNLNGLVLPVTFFWKPNLDQKTGMINLSGLKEFLCETLSEFSKKLSDLNFIHEEKDYCLYIQYRTKQKALLITGKIKCNQEVEELFFFGFSGSHEDLKTCFNYVVCGNQLVDLNEYPKTCFPLRKKQLSTSKLTQIFSIESDKEYFLRILPTLKHFVFLRKNVSFSPLLLNFQAFLQQHKCKLNSVVKIDFLYPSISYSDKHIFFLLTRIHCFKNYIVVKT